MVGLGKFGGGIEKRAAAPFRLGDGHGDHVEDRFELAARVAGARGLGLVPAPPEELVTVFEPGGDERVL